MHHNHVSGFIKETNLAEISREKTEKNLLILYKSRKRHINGLKIQSIAFVPRTEDQPHHYRIRVGDKEARIFIASSRSRELTQRLREMVRVHSIAIVSIHMNDEDKLVRAKLLKDIRLGIVINHRLPTVHRTEKRIQPCWVCMPQAKAA